MIFVNQFKKIAFRVISRFNLFFRFLIHFIEFIIEVKKLFVWNVYFDCNHIRRKFLNIAIKHNCSVQFVFFNSVWKKIISYIFSIIFNSFDVFQKLSEIFIFTNLKNLKNIQIHYFNELINFVFKKCFDALSQFKQLMIIFQHIFNSISFDNEKKNFDVFFLWYMFL